MAAEGQFAQRRNGTLLALTIVMKLSSCGKKAKEQTKTAQCFVQHWLCINRGLLPCRIE